MSQLRTVGEMMDDDAPKSQTMARATIRMSDLERLRAQVARTDPKPPSSTWCCFLWAFTQTGTVDIIERWGKFQDAAQPGCNWVAACHGQYIAGTLSMRIQTLDVIVETKTKDNSFVDVTVNVQYSVLRESVYEAFYKLSNVREQLRSYVFDIVRSEIPKLTLDEVFSQKTQIANAVKADICRSMAQFGYSIDACLVTDVDPSEKIKDAMDGINAAQRERAAAVDKAAAVKIMRLAEAEADSETKYLSGAGMARQREAIADGIARSMERLSSSAKDVSHKELLDTMLMTLHYDTLAQMSHHGKTSTIFVPYGSGTASDMTSQTRAGIMQGMAALSPA